MATTINRTAITDDDGTGTTGTLLDNAWKTELYGQIDDLFESAVSFDATVYINETINSSMTLGLTINQGGADNEILSLKSSDVAHGMTTPTETDTYGAFLKYSGTQGGLLVDGYTEGTVGFALNASGVTDITTKLTSSLAYAVFNAYKKSGASRGAPGADANLCAIQADGTTRFLFDNEGSAHADVEWTTFDTHDDIALLDTLDSAMQARNAVTNAFGEVLRYNADALTKAGIVNFYDDGPRAMVNFTRLSMLHTGALRQLGRKLQRLIEAVRASGSINLGLLES